jgi:hypothetical protein
LLQRPSREEAEAALERLRGLLTGFPWKNEVDRAVALSAILCAVKSFPPWVRSELVLPPGIGGDRAG